MELLSPAGTLESFYAAISNGADAIYLGLDKFSARAYATNFTLENLKPLVDFAHLRNVRIFVTINTILYDDEKILNIKHEHTSLTGGESWISCIYIDYTLVFLVQTYVEKSVLILLCKLCI